MVSYLYLPTICSIVAGQFGIPASDWYLAHYGVNVLFHPSWSLPTLLHRKTELGVDEYRRIQQRKHQKSRMQQWPRSFCPLQAVSSTIMPMKNG